MRRTSFFLYIGFASLLMLGCKDNKKGNDAEGITTALPQEPAIVSVMPLRRTVFHHELISNGKINAQRQANLRFESAEIIAAIYVKNGDRVRQGQKIAELDLFKLNHQLLQAKESMERTELEMRDVLIGQGYGMQTEDQIPSEVLKLAKIRSGYDQARVQYELAQAAYEKATLVAPFDGVIANLFAKPYNQAAPSEAFCSVIDVQGMEVDFTVLESELSRLHIGDPVSVMPYADATARYAGYISEINPLVDANGQVRVKARVAGHNLLFSGMNVRVSVKHALTDCLVIPKTAVVLRSNKEVVFTLKDSIAQWNYVQTGAENADSCVVADKNTAGVTDGLVEGDIVIVSGNLNLAHESPVTVSR